MSKFKVGDTVRALKSSSCKGFITGRTYRVDSLYDDGRGIVVATDSEGRAANGWTVDNFELANWNPQAGSAQNVQCPVVGPGWAPMPLPPGVVTGMTSSLGPIDAPHLISEAPVMTFHEKCHCGASAVGVEKHANNCPRKAVEHLIRVKQ